MPWREVCVVELRRMFISAARSGQKSFAEICREYGISRKTGYKWVNRYKLDGPGGLADRSRRPHRVSEGTDRAVQDMLIAERRAHGVWGVRKLCKRLEMRGVSPPPERTAHRILKRAGLVRVPDGVEEMPTVRFERSRPNDLWQMDHKRAIHGKWARRTVPFCVVDDCTRYCIGLRALPDKGLVSTWSALWGILGEYGLPESVLSDNDHIFHGDNGPSQFEARLMRLGIRILHGRFYHPQTQGKVERFNGTLELELLRDGCFGSSEELQAGFDRFRDTYNFERPHESIDMDVPGARYRPSLRPRPSRLPEMEYQEGAALRSVNKDGWISWKGYCIEVGMGLYGERVEVLEAEYGIEVFYGPYRILGKRLDAFTKKREDKVGGASRRAREGRIPHRATPFASSSPL